MNTVSKLLTIVMAVGLVTSCSELKDDEHYKDSGTVIANDELRIVNMTSEQYLKSRSDLSGMNQLFKEQGIYDELQQKGQLSTMLVVTDDNYQTPEEDVSFNTRAHVSDISMSPANLQDGTRLMMWHGKYTNVSMDEEGLQGNIVDHVMFNNGAVQEVIKTTTGYIYVLSDMIVTPTSLRDYINELPDEYSQFRDMVLASGGKIFDRANSKAIGINEQGNTVYDSVFIYTNEFFDSKNFDMNSESLTATMLLFSNDVIDEAVADAKERMAAMGINFEGRLNSVTTPMTPAVEDSLLRNWILKTAFFRTKYKPEEIQTTEENSISSIYSTIWRTDIQKVDTENPTELSNGVVYNVKKFRLPNQFLIYRMKGHFYIYENCTDEQKEQYFKTSNMKFKEVKNGSAAGNGIYWDPAPGIVPMIPNRCLVYNAGDDGNDASFALDFTPIKLTDEGEIETYKFLPGAYRMAMGFEQNMAVLPTVSVLVNGEVIGKSDKINCVGTTNWHYDRGTMIANPRYPEWYTAGTAPYNFSKNGNYDSDGGQVIPELVIPDANGDGSPVQITIRISADSWNSANLVLHHWCLRPLESNY